MNRRTFFFTVASAGGVAGIAGCLGTGNDGTASDENGTGNGDENGTGNGDENGTGNGDENGTGNGDENGTGNGDENGTGNGDENGTGNGDENGTGNGDENGTGNGDENGTGNGDDDEPQAAFDWNPAEPGIRERVTFDASNSTGDIVEYRWDLTGDGSFDETNSEPVTTRSFGEATWATVSLEVADSEGRTSQTSRDVPIGVTLDLTATFSWDPEPPVVDDVVVFDASAATGDIVEYRWDLTGDGSFDEILSGSMVTHVFDEAGTTEVTLEVESSAGQVESVTESVTVQEQTTAAFSWEPAEPVAGETVTLDAADSVGDIVEYRWDVTNDGTIDATTTDPITTHTFEAVGLPVVRLEVEDSDGRTAWTDAAIPISEPDPGLQIQFDWSPRVPQPGEPVFFDAAATTEDIVEYRWDFTDDGSFDVTTSDPVTSHTFEGEGVVTVSLEVEDAAGETATATGEVDVGGETDTGPAAMFRWEPVEPTVGEEVTFDGIISSGDIVEYRWDFTDDGSFDVTTSDFTATHTFEEAGRFEVHLEVEDSDGRTDSRTSTIEIHNDDT